ncbi:MAG: histidine phosphatase family protein [Prevotella sp.]|nr:histidine phosphatase family protein [Prevotella sp.]
MTKIYLVRHGETVDNVNQIMQGQTQGVLTANGILQAEKLAQQLAHTTVDAFVASDLQRSIDTCTIIARPHAATVVTTPLLRERDWGDFTGRYIPDLRGLDFPPNVESLDALKTRARKFLDYIASTFPGQTVVAVGHGIINKAIQAVHYGKTMPEIARMANGEIRELELE